MLFYCSKGNFNAHRGSNRSRIMCALAPNKVTLKPWSPPTMGTTLCFTCFTCTMHPQTHKELLSLDGLVRKRPPAAA